MGNPKSPCKNCEKRAVGCHSSCEDYISFKERNDALRDHTNFEKAKMYGSSYFSNKKSVTRMLDRNRNYSA